ncbi:MAG: DUF1549 and DUF1553 domain-containing protein [Verrucomicrobiota bacterium]
MKPCFFLFACILGGLPFDLVLGGKGPEPVTFIDDVLPALTRAGCNGSSCHSKPQGQNGFQLSVFAFDPKADFHEIVFEQRGRRLSPGAPEDSLLLKKATLQVPHEGGERFARGSATYHLLVDWVESGLPYHDAEEGLLESIEVSPGPGFYTPGQTFSLAVEAIYDNGRRRDVTALSEFESHKDHLAEVDEDGQVRVLSNHGDAVLIARYMGQVATTRVTVKPEGVVVPEGQLDEFRLSDSFIDRLSADRFRELGLSPSDRCSDGDFLRRVSLDLIGTLPTEAEARAFLNDSSPDKRERWVDDRLAHPAYADHWAVKWADLLRGNPDRVGIKSVYVLDQWIRESFRRNQPYDAFAREILTARGGTHSFGPTVIFRDRRKPEDITTLISQIFLGVRLECAKCHHHPNEKWSQKDFYQLAAVFGRLKQQGPGVSPPISGGQEFFFPVTSGSVAHPVTKAVMDMRPPDGPVLEAGEDPRVALADWLVEPENPFFAKAAVNRVWGELMGRGFVEPVDDFRASNPPTHPELLDALAAEFVRGGYDFKKLLKAITLSAVYQRSSVPGPGNIKDVENYARSYRRRLPAEVMADAVAHLTGMPDRYSGMPPGARALETWNYKIQSDLMDAFGRPDASSDCPCERNRSASVVQALHLMHAEGLQSKLADQKGRAYQLASSDLAEEAIVEKVYLAAFSRFPGAEEKERALSVFSAEGATRQTATEDLMWALINSAEFVFNH